MDTPMLAEQQSPSYISCVQMLEVDRELASSDI